VIPASARRVHPTSGEENFMNVMRITGIVLILLGLVGFFTGGFSFTKDTSKAKIGPIELVVKEKETVNFPQWLSIGAVVLGAVVLVMGSRKS
jgi:multidrug transporter EmrE-like cation transporter